MQCPMGLGSSFRQFYVLWVHVRMYWTEWFLCFRKRVWNLLIYFSYANTFATVLQSLSPLSQSSVVAAESRHWVRILWPVILFQVMETIQWLSNFFYKLRLSTLDFKSFGLFSKWSPYMADMKTLLGYLVKRLLDSEMACLAQDPSASSKAGNMPLVQQRVGCSDLPSEETWIDTWRDLNLSNKIKYLSVKKKKQEICSVGVNPSMCHTSVPPHRGACFSLSLPLLHRAGCKEMGFNL